MKSVIKECHQVNISLVHFGAESFKNSGKEIEMSRQSDWRKKMASSGAVVPDTRALYGVGIAYLGLVAVSIITFSTILFLGLLEILQREGPQIMKAAATPAGVVSVVVAVLALGGGIAFLKQGNLALFACIELGAAIALTIEACQRLALSEELAVFAVTLFPAMYLAVTGVENLYKAYKEWRSEKREREMRAES